MSNIKNFKLLIEQRVQASKSFLEKTQNVNQSDDRTLGGHFLPRRVSKPKPEIAPFEILNIIDKKQGMKPVCIEINKQPGSTKKPVLENHTAQCSTSMFNDETAKSQSPVEKSKPYEPLLRFFVKNGIPLHHVEDKHFEEFCTESNKTGENFEKPTYESLKKCLLDSQKNETISQWSNRKVFSTFGYIREEEVTYLAFSLHGYDKKQLRKEQFHLLKLDSFEYDNPSLINIILEKTHIDRFVVNDQELAHSLFGDDSFYEYSVCFNTHLTNFINEVISIPEFQQPADMLIDMVARIKSDTSFYKRFRTLRGNSTWMLPSVDVASWESICLFLAKCSEIRSSLSSMSEVVGSDVFSQPHERNLWLLTKMLVFCLKCAHQIANDNFVSVVVPIIIKIMKFVDEEMSNFSRNIQELIDIHLFPLISNMKYMLGCLFDPRFAYSTTIYPEETWCEIELMIANVNEKNTDKTVREKLVEIAQIKRQLVRYRALIEKERPDKYSSPLDWWNKKSKEMKQLFNVAKDVLCQPAVAIDVHYYFGKNGKYKHICSVLNDEELIQYLEAAGKEEKIRNKGTISEKDVNWIMLHENHQNEEEEEKNESDEIKSCETSHEQPEPQKLLLLAPKTLINDPIGAEYLMAEPSRKLLARKYTRSDRNPVTEQMSDLDCKNECEPLEKIMKIEADCLNDMAGPSHQIKVEIKKELLTEHNCCDICANNSQNNIVCVENIDEIDKQFISISQLLNEEICLNDAIERTRKRTFNVCQGHCLYYSRKLLTFLGAENWQNVPSRSMTKLHNVLKSTYYEIDNNSFIQAFQTFFEKYHV